MMAAQAAAPVKLTGWFACEKCTAARVAKGDIRPSNPECARQCITKGDEAAYASQALAQRHKGFQEIDVTFENPRANGDGVSTIGPDDEQHPTAQGR